MVFIPIGRKIKQALIQERRREALKQKNEAVSRKGDSLSTGHVCVGTTTLDIKSINSFCKWYFSCKSWHFYGITS